MGEAKCKEKGHKKSNVPSHHGSPFPMMSDDVDVKATLDKE